jgi:hypothetical protein
LRGDTPEGVLNGLVNMKPHNLISGFSKCTI